MGPLLLAAALLVPTPCAAQTGFSIEAFGGAAFSAGSTLSLQQTGEPTLEFAADWETRPFDVPIYWAVRAAWLSERSGWEVQLVHHKLYLTNPPPEVEDLEITHGFNFVTAAWVYRGLPVDLRAGAGVVLPRVSATVRGREFQSQNGQIGDYTISGPALLVGAGKRVGLAGGLFASFDVQGTAGWIDVPVTGGRVRTSNLALHLMAGLGYAF